MAKWFQIVGDNPQKIREALKALSRHCETRPGIEGSSFYVRIRGGREDFLKRILQEVGGGLAIRLTVAGSPDLQEEREGIQVNQPVNTQAEVGKEKKPFSFLSEEELINLFQHYTLGQIVAMYGVPRPEVTRRLNTISKEARRTIERTLICSQCNAKFTGPKARWKYATHIRFRHKKLAEPSVKPEETKKEPTEDEVLLQGVRTKASLFKQRIADLESQKAKAIDEARNRISEEWDAKIAQVRAEMGQFQQRMLDALTLD